MTSFKRFPPPRWIRGIVISNREEKAAIFSRSREIIPRKRWSPLLLPSQLNPPLLKDLASAWEQLFEQSRRRSPFTTFESARYAQQWYSKRSVARGSVIHCEAGATVTHAYPTTMRPSFQATIQPRGQPSASPKRIHTHNADIRKGTVASHTRLASPRLWDG